MILIDDPRNDPNMLQYCVGSLYICLKIIIDVDGVEKKYSIAFLKQFFLSEISLLHANRIMQEET